MNALTLCIESTVSSRAFIEAHRNADMAISKYYPIGSTSYIHILFTNVTHKYHFIALYRLTPIDQQGKMVEQDGSELQFVEPVAQCVVVVRNVEKAISYYQVLQACEEYGGKDAFYSSYVCDNIVQQILLTSDRVLSVLQVAATVVDNPSCCKVLVQIGKTVREMPTLYDYCQTDKETTLTKQFNYNRDAALTMHHILYPNRVLLPVPGVRIQPDMQKEYFAVVFTQGSSAGKQIMGEFNPALVSTEHNYVMFESNQQANRQVWTWSLFHQIDVEKDIQKNPTVLMQVAAASVDPDTWVMPYNPTISVTATVSGVHSIMPHDMYEEIINRLIYHTGRNSIWFVGTGFKQGSLLFNDIEIAVKFLQRLHCVIDVDYKWYVDNKLQVPVVLDKEVLSDSGKYMLNLAIRDIIKWCAKQFPAARKLIWHEDRLMYSFNATEEEEEDKEVILDLTSDNDQERPAVPMAPRKKRRMD